MTRLLVEKLLSAPTRQLKAATDEGAVAAYAEALNHLFRLADDERGAPGAAAPRSAAGRLVASTRGRGR